MPPQIHLLDDPGDQRLADYRALKEHRLAESSGRFVAESELVVRKLLASGLVVRSLLATAPRLRTLDEVLRAHPGDFPVYLVPQRIVDAVAGFHVHRGCLAVAERPPRAELPPQARTIVVLEGLTDIENVGAMARNAAALGADGLVLSPRSADPFYRKAIRVSAGAVFVLPILRLARWPEDLLDLRDRLGFTLVGAVLDSQATPVDRFARPERMALLLGSEGPGLLPATRQLCHALVTIPMAPGADSLNVATAGAIVLHQLLHRGSRVT
jgi:tRNA G18 (ribose-2'-O)-methylase SpoU